MLLITYIAAMLAVLSFTFTIIFLRTRRDELGLLFSGYMFSATLWIGGNAVADVSYTPYALIVASTVALIGAMLNLISFLFLIDFLVDGRLPSCRRVLIYVMPPSIIILLSGSPYAIRDVLFPINEAAQVVPGNLYIFTLILTLIGSGYGASCLYKELQRQHRKETQTKFIYVLAGLCLTTIGGAIFSVLLPLFGELRFYSLGPVSTIFFALATGYSITRQKLLDFGFVIQRGVIYTILFAIIVSFYLCVIQALYYVLPLHAELGTLVGAIGTTVFGIVTTPSIERYFRKVTDHFFFKEKYDYAVAMHALSTVLYSHVEFEDLVRESEAELKLIFRASSVKIEFEPAEGLYPEKIGALRVPILLDGLSIGCIYLGPKQSGDSYSSVDAQLLQTFAYQAATSLSRALLYTETKKHAIELEDRVAERTSQLSKAYDRERQIINDISHSLQTPLTVLQTKLDKLKSTTVDSDVVSSLEQSLTKVSGFIYDLLSLARLEAETSVEEFSLLDVSSLIDELVDEVRIVANEYNIIVKKDISSCLLVYGNSRQLRDAFMNLISNSIKYMGRGSDRSIAVSLHQMGGLVVITVQDTGIGISHEDLPFIFDRFYRGKDTENKFSGTGIGLSIVECIVKKHRGTIKIQNIPTGGTRAQMLLPTSNFSC
jgi:signal transduction histidine kinase